MDYIFVGSPENSNRLHSQQITAIEDLQKYLNNDEEETEPKRNSNKINLVTHIYFVVIIILLLVIFWNVYKIQKEIKDTFLE